MSASCRARCGSPGSCSAARWRGGCRTICAAGRPAAFCGSAAARPSGDVIRSGPTPRAERLIAPHPSLKPQSFLRHLVRAALPRQQGVILDPFAGSGSTLAAANAVGYPSIGVELDEAYFSLARRAVPALTALAPVDPAGAQLEDAGPVQRRRARA